MQFSIVIPTFNNLEELRGCLNALERQIRQDFEVFVCVDGSTDGTIEALEGAQFHFPLYIKTHPNHQNEGRAATRNLALDGLNGKFTLFLDSDMQAAPDLLDQHLKILAQEKSISIGTVIYRNQHENIWAKYTSERGVGKFSHGEEVPFHYFITPNTAVPTEWFRGVGGFDPAISRYGGEDMELGYRIHKKYHPRYIFNREARVFTVQEKPLPTALLQLKEYGETGLPYIVNKHPELNKVYWVDKCARSNWKDAFFELLIGQPFRGMATFLVKISPYAIQKTLINYLVISHIHEGFRNSAQSQ